MQARRIALRPEHVGGLWIIFASGVKFARSCMEMLQCRVGAFRLLDLLKELKFPVSLLVNSEIYNHCPEVPAAYCQQLADIGRACEIVGHGCSNAERQVSFAASFTQHSRSIVLVGDI